MPNVSSSRRRKWRGYSRIHPAAIEETEALSEKLTFSLKDLAYEYPDEDMQGFASPQEALTHLTYEGAKWRYPGWRACCGDGDFGA